MPATANTQTIPDSGGMVTCLPHVVLALRDDGTRYLQKRVKVVLDLPQRPVPLTFDLPADAAGAMVAALTEARW